MIRFACPGCKCVLSGREEQAGKLVRCPKCGQRMQTPRSMAGDVENVPRRKVRAPASKTSRRPLVVGFVVAAILLAGAGGGMWMRMHFRHDEPEPVVAVRATPPTPASASAPEPPPRVGRAERDPPAHPDRSRNESQPTPKPPAPPVEKPPPIEDKKEIDLADDVPPELPFDLVDAINVQRRKAGREPIFLDAEASRACQARAEQLAHRGTPNEPADTVAAEAPLAALEKALREPKRRAAILEPRLRTFGAGFARNIEGQWFSVFDWTRGIDGEPPLTATAVTGAIVYPAPGQLRVPLGFPGNETPDPLPEAKDKLAGYPITLTFPPATRIEKVTAHLANKDERDLAVWLSSPEKPANPHFAQAQQHTICLIAKKPLRPNTRYRVEVSATVNGEPWSAKWSFVTISEGELHHELAGAFLRTLNRLRRRAGLPPARLNAERSKVCAAHARYLGRNAPSHPRLNWNEEKPDLPGYTAEGAAVAERASIQGGGGPIQAVAGLIDSLISRPQLLDPCLNELGLGYAPFAFGGWIWVIELRQGSGRDTDKEYFYPAPDQDNVPLVYPPNEAPSPIPAEHKGRLAGYAITALFGPRARVTAAKGKLVDAKGDDVDGWLSSPDEPAIAGFPQRSLCFLPKSPLRPDTRYTATFQAEVNGRPWRRTWRFTTLQEPDRFSDDLDEQIVARVNAVRKSAGLSPVRLDTELSRGCQSHARYLALNYERAAGRGMNVHRQDADLPGASPQGARAAKESVIAVVLDPQTCVEGWMATLYHRIPILTPNLERVGFGHARIQGHKWACVLDTGNGRTTSR